MKRRNVDFLFGINKLGALIRSKALEVCHRNK